MPPRPFPEKRPKPGGDDDTLCLLRSLEDQVILFGKTIEEISSQHEQDIARATADFRTANEVLAHENDELRKRAVRGGSSTGLPQCLPSADVTSEAPTHGGAAAGDVRAPGAENADAVGTVEHLAREGRGPAPFRKPAADGILACSSDSPANLRARRAHRSACSVGGKEAAGNPQVQLAANASKIMDLWPLWRSRGNAAATSPELQSHRSLNMFRVQRAKPSAAPSNRLQRALQWLVVLPNNWLNFLWESIGCAFILYEVVMIPMQNFHLPSAEFFIQEAWAASIYWTLDVPRQFFISYEEMGCVETRLLPIAWRYLKTWFVPDVLVLTLDWILLILGQEGAGSRSWKLGAKAVRMLRALRLVRLVRVFKMGRYCKNLMDNVLSHQLRFAIKVTYVTVCVMLCAHYVACYWYALTNLHWIRQDNTWVQQQQLEGSDVAVVYVKSLYWSFAQSGFASTNIYPTNWLEEVFTSIMSLMWLLMTACVFSWFTVWALQLRDVSDGRETRETQLRIYLKQHRIPTDLANKVIRYLRMNYGKVTARLHTPDIVLLSNLPVDLLMELHTQVFSPILLAHPAFACLDAGGLEAVCHFAIAEQHYTPGQTVFARGGEAEHMLFVVVGDLHYDGNWQAAPSTGPQVCGGGARICEAVLWRHWRHAGLLTARTSCELIGVDSSKLRAALAAAESRNECSLADARSYARRAAIAFEKHAATKAPTDLWDSEIALAIEVGDLTITSSRASRDSTGSIVAQLGSFVTTWGRMSAANLNGAVRKETE